MNAISKQAKTLIAALCAASVLPAAPAQQPSAGEILRASRITHIRQEARLNAQLRSASATTPFVISLSGGVISYGFSNPEQEILLTLREDSSDLSERTGGKSSTVRPAKYDDPVRGTNVTYEDLALRFLYWPNPKVLGDDTVRSRRTWKLEIQAPRGASQYGVARLWIDKESGAVLRIEGFDMKGRLAKRFEMISAQKIDGQWMLKQMRVESFNPETRKITDRTYLEVKRG